MLSRQSQFLLPSSRWNFYIMKPKVNQRLYLSPEHDLIHIHFDHFFFYHVLSLPSILITPRLLTPNKSSLYGFVINAHLDLPVSFFVCLSTHLCFLLPMASPREVELLESFQWGAVNSRLSKSLLVYCCL